MLLVEPLESRTLLAGNLLSAVGELPTLGPVDADASVPVLQAAATVGQQQAEGESQAEGEDVQDLVAFAKALTQAGVKYYSAAWCSNCTAQKQLFQDGAEYLPNIEAANPDHTLNDVGTAAGIEYFPTWVFPDTSRLTGVQTLATISERSNVAIPTSSTPSLKPIEDTTLLANSPLFIPLDGYDPNGDALTYTVTSSNSQVTATIPQSNPYWKISVKDYGDMVFQLFEDKAPRPAGRVIELTESNFYDGLTFHRIISGFVIQGGDPTGTGSGGSDLGDFDDQFHVDLQHSREGILSFAKSTDDTNDSQFFVTLGPTRHLDFNHSVFGVLVEGYPVLEALGQVPTDSSDKPTATVTMTQVDMIDDVENAVVMLKAPEGYTGAADITVTVSDGNGHSTQETFHVSVLPDTTANGGANGGPFLKDIVAPTTTRNTPVQLQLQSVDVEGDAVKYEGSKSGSVNATVQANADTGLVTITPPTDYVGPMSVLVGVAPKTSSTTSDTWDTQTLTVQVTPNAPTLALTAASDSGIAGDNITNATTLTFRVANVISGATVKILNGTTVLGTGTASGTSIDISVNMAASSDGSYNLTAVQTVSSVDSPASAVLTVKLDRTAPAAFTSTPPASAPAAAPVVYDAQNPEEGTAGFAYSLSNAPTGATINATTGVLAWTPTAAQIGSHSFQIVAADAAGNTTSQNATIEVVAATVQVRLATADTSGNAITHIAIGQDFLMQVYVQDLRSGTSAQGVFAMYADYHYDATLVTSLAAALSDVTFSSTYNNGQMGSLTTAGLLNDIGAFGPTTPVGANEKLLLSVTMNATHSGTAVFTGDAAEGVGTEALVYGSNDPVPWAEVAFLPATLTIDPGLSAVADVFNFDEDSGQHTLDVLANDTNPAGGTLTITQTGATNHGGTVAIATDHLSLNYTPAANYNGEETFTYTISNGTGTSTGTVTVQVQAVNDAPTANADTVTVTANSSSNFVDVLANDTITPDTGETLRVTAVGTPSQGGTVTIAPNGTNLLYTPKAGFTGTETVTYTISDRTTGGLTSQATVTVTVNAQNAPTAVADTAIVAEDSTNNVIAVLSNDTPKTAGKTLTVTAVAQPTTGGTATIGTGGANVLFTPTANFSGTATFTYTVQEQDGGTAQANVTVTVNPQDAPTVVADTATVAEDSADNVISVLSNDTPLVAGKTLTITAVTQPTTGGTVTIGTGGANVKFTPTANFSGTATFTYTVKETDGGTAQGAVTVTVTAVNDVPQATADVFTVLKDGGTQTLDVLANDSTQPDTGEALRIKEVTQPTSGGTVAIATDGLSLNFTPTAGFQGDATFNYTITDRSGTDGLTAQAAVTVHVSPYTPRDIGGTVTYYGNVESAGWTLGGIEVKLAGTDSFSQTISQSVTTAAHGAYVFNDLAPGTYTVQQTTPMFLLAGTSQLTVESDATDSDSTANNLQNNGRQARYVSIIDFLADAPRQSSHSPDDALLAAVETGNGQRWYTVEAGWSGYTEFEFTLSADAKTLTVTAVHSDGTNYEGAVELTDSPVTVLGHDGDNYLLRIIGGAADLGLEETTSTTGGEGEAAPNAARVAQSVRSARTSTTASAEGESAVAVMPAAYAVTAAGEGESVAALTAPVYAALAPADLLAEPVRSVTDAALAASAFTVTAAEASSVPVPATAATPVTVTTTTAADAEHAALVDAALADEQLLTPAVEQTLVTPPDAEADDFAPAVDGVFEDEPLAALV